MHKVERNEAPLELIKKDGEWKNQLMIDQDLNHDWSKFSRTALKKETLKHLKDMYGGCCCYCEGKPGSVSYAEIEHFKPKSSFKELCFDYSNLHYSCKRCNLAKSNKINRMMFNASDDNPEDYINYVGEIAVSIDIGERGKEMIDVLKLNERSDLKEERSKYFNKFTRQFELIVSALQEVDMLTAQSINLIKPFINEFVNGVESKSKHGESYCTMIKHNFCDKIKMLKEVLL
ncbi:retron system putative HNH endonuclease [Clostridium sp.]